MQIIFAEIGKAAILSCGGPEIIEDGGERGGGGGGGHGASGASHPQFICIHTARTDT